MISYGKGSIPVSKAVRAANVSLAPARGCREVPEAQGQPQVHPRNTLCMPRMCTPSVHIMRRCSNGDRGWISGNPFPLLPLLEILHAIFFRPCHTTCRILVPQPGIEPMPPAVEVQGPNHCTIREVPPCAIFNFPLQHVDNDMRIRVRVCVEKKTRLASQARKNSCFSLIRIRK